MATGTPVVCSWIEPLKEVAGEAALFVDPFNAAAIAQGILKVIKEKETSERLVKKGLERAREFTWGRTAEATIALLKSYAYAGKRA